MNVCGASYSLIEDELQKHGVCAINTTGNSMRPMLSTNDAVTVKLPDRKLKKYDVVLYKDSKGRYILHRIIGFRGETLIIRGDNTYKKEYVFLDSVLAYMISYVKGGKIYDAKRLGYRVYSRFWNFIYPFRRVMRKVKSILKKKKT